MFVFGKHVLKVTKPPTHIQFTHHTIKLCSFRLRLLVLDFLRGEFFTLYSSSTKPYGGGEISTRSNGSRLVIFVKALAVFWGSPRHITDG